MLFRKLLMAVFVGLGLFGLSGCDANIGRFPSNHLYGLVAARREAMQGLPPQADVEATIVGLFGTPDQPQLPAGLSPWLNQEALHRAAGPISSDQEGVHVGLYREHCATCHGIDGGGAGPAAALLNPYPRDFRPGVFKFKSTSRADKPTQTDLISLLRRGIPGTAMPSFATERDDDLEALGQYVIYLSIRGETERGLIDMVARDELSRDELRTQGQEIAEAVAAKWRAADGQVLQVPPPAGASSDRAARDWWADEALVTRGRELFHGPLANCASCHGPGGDGTATTLDFDDWTKEFTTKLGISPSDRDGLKPMRKAGALRPRPAPPRKLQWGVFHGPDHDVALYRRLVTGIAGTPMPGLLIKDKPEAVGVEATDVWAIIAYLRSLKT